MKWDNCSCDLQQTNQLNEHKFFYKLTCIIFLMKDIANMLKVISVT